MIVIFSSRWVIFSSRWVSESHERINRLLWESFSFSSHFVQPQSLCVISSLYIYVLFLCIMYSMKTAWSNLDVVHPKSMLLILFSILLNKLQKRQTFESPIPTQNNLLRSRSWDGVFELVLNIFRCTMAKKMKIIISNFHLTIDFIKVCE